MFGSKFAQISEYSQNANQAYSNMELKRKEIEGIYQALIPTLTAALETNVNYQTLEEPIKQVILDALKNIPLD